MNDGSTKSETPSVRPIEQRGEVVYKLTLGLRILSLTFLIVVIKSIKANFMAL
jgi:hypothetical protein